MNDRELDLTEAQKAIKAKYPAINKKYEYLDHTADVQLHSWGDSLEEAYEQCAMAMFGYMTDTETVEPIDTIEIESEGDDLESLLFHFLDDWLFKFSADAFFVPREVKVLHLDRMRFTIRSIGTCICFHFSHFPAFDSNSSSSVVGVRSSTWKNIHKAQK
ncbi:protein archease isoform X1 [Ictalurus punctatus]|uniref:Protein archease n=1 Tax=Ictalurus punctatus TaxID=7998 RepID=A0A979EQ07_ICTPU|nr:protein archease isoform X1 [Ictalurus punctatus]